MVLENKNSNGSSSVKIDPLKSEPGLPALRPQLGLWGKGCQPVNGIASQVKSDQPVSVDLSPVRPVINTRPPPKIIIPPRPQEDRQTELSSSWRDRRFEQEKRPWNEKPAVSTRRPEFNDRFDPRFDRRDYRDHRDHRYPSDKRYQNNGHGRPEEEDPDWDGGWDDPDENNPFEFGEHTELPGHRTEQVKALSNPRSPDPPERPSSVTEKRSSIPRSDSPDMESRMMSELLKIFDDNEVTEIPVVTNPGGSRILGLIHQQDHQQQPPSYADQMMRQPSVHSSSGDPFRQQSFPPVSRPSPGPVSFPFGSHGQPQQGQSDGVGNELLQILQKAKINVNNLVSNTNYTVPSLNVAQAKSLAEIEGGLAVSRTPVVGQSSPKPESSENHAFNKLLEMISSSRNRTGEFPFMIETSVLSKNESDHLDTFPAENNHLGQQPFSSHELEKMHDERKRMEQVQQEVRRDSVGSGTPRSFVPIQVMRQARTHFQEQVPSRPVIGRTSSGSSGGAPGSFPGQGQQQFGPRMGMNEAEMRHLAQFRPGGPAIPIRGPVGGLGRNSPVNLLQHQQSQQFMMSQQLRGGPFGPITQPPLHPFGPGGMGQPSQQMLVGGPRGGMPIPNHHLQSRPPSSQQQPMNLQQLQMLNQHLHSLPPQQLNDMPRGMTSEQLNQILLRATHQ